LYQHLIVCEPVCNSIANPFCALQEVVKPDVFWYDAPTKIDLPFNIVGLLAFEFFAMHFVELKRWQDFRNPGSVDTDPLFPSNKLAPHEVRLRTIVRVYVH
jgi:hypothetical protein